MSTLTPEQRIAAAAEDRRLLAELLADGARAPPRAAGPASEPTPEMHKRLTSNDDDMPREKPTPTRKAT